MSLKTDYKAIFIILWGIFFFACINSANFYIIEPFLLTNKNLNGEQLDHFAQARLLGLMIAAFTLTQLINKLNAQRIIIISLFILALCTFNLIVLNDFKLLKINFTIISCAAYAYFTSSVTHIIESSETKKYFFVSLVILLWSAGHIIVSAISDLLKPTNSTIIICILLYCINILIELSYSEKPLEIAKSNSKFSLLIKNIELQLLTGFVVAYVTFDILWYYEAFALKMELVLINSTLILVYINIAIFCSIVPMAYLLNKTNKYTANLLLTLILLSSFILLPFYGENKDWNIAFIIIIGVCLCSIFICNILILIDKFKDSELRTTIFSYFSMCSVGIYAGALSSYVPYGLDKESDFLFSIFSVVGSFVLYYFWYFIRHKLYL